MAADKEDGSSGAIQAGVDAAVFVDQRILKPLKVPIIAEPSKAEVTDRYETKWYRWYVLAVLTGVYTFNFIDRQILNILQVPIKAEFDLSNTQLGIMTGFSFALFYVVAGIPIARLADSGNRRNVITVALVIWSGMTAISGAAMNYTHLLLARIGVSIGEAGGSPPAHSMIRTSSKGRTGNRALDLFDGHQHWRLAGLLARWLDRRVFRMAHCLPRGRRSRNTLRTALTFYSPGTAQRVCRKNQNR